MPSLHTGVDATKQGGLKRVDRMTPPSTPVALNPLVKRI